MTTLAPPPTEPTARPPTPPARQRQVKPWAVVFATTAAIALTALLNCEQLVTTAKRMPFGTERTVALRLADANRQIARFLWLDRPRHGVDVAIGHAPHRTPAVIPVPAGSVEPVPTGSTLPTPTPTPTPTRPSAQHPLRIYFGGDSVADQVGDGLLQIESSDRLVRVRTDARISTGLTRPDYFNWTARLMDVLSERSRPQVVIVMFGANDVQGIMTSSGAADVGSRRWLAEYRRRVAATMERLSRSGVDVYWLGQPLMRSSYFSARISELDAIYASEASRHPHITFVDTRPLLADRDGHYAAYLPDARGNPVLMRSSDGVHLSLAGAKRVATAVMSLVKQRWELD